MRELFARKPALGVAHREGIAESNEATVTIQHGYNVVLDLGDNEYEVTHGRVLAMAIDEGVLANDQIVIQDGNQEPVEVRNLTDDFGQWTAEPIDAPAGLVFHDDGLFSFEAPGETGPVAFTYRVTHESGISEEAQVVINVVNAAPSAGNASYEAVMGRTLLVERDRGLGFYASDADGDLLSFSLGQGTVVDGEGTNPGAVTLFDSGAFLYNPPSDTFVGTVEFAYTVDDGIDESEPANLTIHVVGSNAAPQVEDRAYEVFHRDELHVSRWEGLLAQAIDPDGDPMAISIVAYDSPLGDSDLQQRLQVRPGGSFSYSPPANQHLEGQGDLEFQESAQFRATDLFGNESGLATVTFHVVGRAPTAHDDAYEVDRDERLVVSQRSGLLANDEDEDGDLLSAELVDEPEKGDLSYFSASGAFVYLPEEGFTGNDTFSYRASDGTRVSDVATVTITVNAVDETPVVENMSYSIFHNNPGRLLSGGGKRYEQSTARGAALAGDRLVVSAWKGVLAEANDPQGHPLTAVLVDEPEHGALAAFDAVGSFTYVPDAGFVGTDSFTFRATNGQKESELGTVTIEVTNTAPQPREDRYQIAPNQTLTTSVLNGVLANDFDAEHDPLTAELVSAPDHGTLDFSETGAFTYTPEADYLGADTFTYRASDGIVQSAPVSVTITVTETPTPEPPSTGSNAYTLTHGSTLTVPVGPEGLLGNDYTFNDGGLTVELVDDVGEGTLDLNPGGGFTYTPDPGFVGSDSFTYRAVDAFGQSDPTLVTLDVTNEAPVAEDRSHEIKSGESLFVSFVEGVVATASDEDGDELTASLIADVPAADGDLTFNADGSYRFTPAEGYTGITDFSYQVSDGLADSAVHVVTIEVVNEKPAASDLAYTMTRGGILVVDADDGLLANASDADGDRLVLDVSEPSGLQVWPTGAFIYEPPNDFVGEVTFSYTVDDGTESSGDATVTIDVTTEAPQATDSGPYSIRHDRVLIVDAEDGILVNDSSPDGHRIVPVLVDGPSHGTLNLNDDGSFSFTPTSVPTGSSPLEDSFVYRLDTADGVESSNEATVSIHIDYSAPQAQDDPVDSPGGSGRKPYRTIRNQPLIIYAEDGVLSNDANPEDAALTLTVADEPADGSVDLRANGAFVYTPDVNFTGGDSFTYTITDGITNSTATAFVEVTEPSLTVDDHTFAVIENWILFVTPDDSSTQRWSGPGLHIGSLAEDASIPDDAVAQFTVVQNPSDGQLQMGDHGGFVYRPDGGFSGTDSFTYRFTTEHGDSNAATVTLNVGPAPPPAATSITLAVPRHAVATTLDLENKHDLVGFAQSQVPDHHDAEARLVELSGGEPEGTGQAEMEGEYGTAALSSDGVLFYTPDATKIGTEAGPLQDTFHYAWFAGDQFGDSATITVQIAEATPLNVGNVLPGHSQHAALHVAAAGEGSSGEGTTAFALADLASDGDFCWADDDVTVQVVSASGTQEYGTATASGAEGTITYQHASGEPTVSEPLADEVRFELTHQASGRSATGHLLVLIYHPKYTFPEEDDGPHTKALASVPEIADTFVATAMNAVEQARVVEFKQGQDLLWARTEEKRQEVEAQFDAAKTRATAAKSAAVDQQASLRPSVQALAEAALDADEAQIQAEREAEVGEREADRLASLENWETLTAAAVAYEAELHGHLQQHEQVLTAAQLAQIQDISAARSQFEVSAESHRDALMADLKQAGSNLADARAAADAQYFNSLEAIEDQFDSDIETAADVRDAAVKAARNALLAAQDQIRDDLESAQDSATSAYATAVATAVAARDDALAQAQTDLDDAIAVADAEYANGPDDESSTNALELGDDQDYLNDVATTHATYDAAVTSAGATFDSAMSAARNTLHTAIDDARAAADAALVAADDAYRDAVADAEDVYDTQVLGALTTYETAVANARVQLQSSLASANASFNTSMSTADETFDNQVQDAVQTLHDDRVAAIASYDNELAMALSAYESTMSPHDDSHHDALLTYRNTFDAGQVAALSNYSQARMQASQTLKQQMESAEAAWQNTMLASADTWLDTQENAQEQLKSLMQAAEAAWITAEADAEQVYRNAKQQARDAEQQNKRAAFEGYAAEVHPAQYDLAQAMGMTYLQPFTFSSEDLIGTLAPDVAMQLEQIKSTVLDQIKAELDRELGEADGRLATNSAMNAARDQRVSTINAATEAYYNAYADAERDFLDALAEAEAVHRAEERTAEVAFHTAEANARRDWAQAVADAAADWRGELAALNTTWADDVSDANHSYAQTQAQAADTYAKDQAAANEALATAVAAAQTDAATTSQNALSGWQTAHASAVTSLTDSRAQAQASYASSLAQATASFDNAVMTAATDLFLSISNAQETRAIAYADGLSDMVQAVTGATATFHGIVLGEAGTYRSAERSAFETLIEDVHDARVAAIDDWDDPESVTELRQ